MPFVIVRQNITRMSVDAVVNAANKDLMAGSGVCGAIFDAAGYKELQAACNKLSPIKTGEAVITPSFDMTCCKYIIHAVGPIYSTDRAERCREQLFSAYRSSLELAKANGCSSIAFPLISGGIYGYPKKEALKVAKEAIDAFLEKNDMDVYMALFDKEALDVGKELIGRIESYISQYYVDCHTDKNRSLSSNQTYQFLKDSAQMDYEMPEGSMISGVDSCSYVGTDKDAAVPPWMSNLDEPFGVTLTKLIDEKGMDDVSVYKRANIDRKLFSKIRAGKGYMPGKKTVLALAISMRLTQEETGQLLARAGYAITHSQLFDVIVEYFIVSGEYDIFKINETLFQYDQPLLGC